MKNISRTVVILSVVSFFTDVATEMLYPIMPVYLSSIGFSIVLIGILEGIAEAIAGLSKGYFGKLSDNSGKRLPFVQLGYAFSAISKPMMAVIVYPLWIFFARTLDRFGTGIGPLFALAYLYFNPKDYKNLFYIAFIPGVLALLSTFILEDKVKSTPKKRESVKLVDFISYLKTGPKMYRKLLIGLLLFALFNSSDVFLLLKVKETGVDDSYVIGMYIFYNLIYALLAFPLGVLADKLGLKKVFLIGLILFAIVYFGMAVVHSIYGLVVLFLIYGAYSASTEGISKAWISNISDRRDTATAIGTFAGLQSICTMLASVFTGLIWFNYGATATFICTGIITVIVLIYIYFNVKENITIEQTPLDV